MKEGTRIVNGEEMPNWYFDPAVIKETYEASKRGDNYDQLLPMLKEKNLVPENINVMDLIAPGRRYRVPYSGKPGEST